MNEQEQFWHGEFGDEYIERNNIDVASRIKFFKKLVILTGELDSACEIGPNAGHNLAALHSLNSNSKLTGIEINKTAYEKLQECSYVTAVNCSIHEFDSDQCFELVMTCGVLIHLNPNELSYTYDKLFNLSNKYILISEYFNPTPTTVSYRGEQERLFKRDFAGEVLDRYPNDLELVDYGFLWKRAEPSWDNQTWFLLKRK